MTKDNIDLFNSEGHHFYLQFAMLFRRGVIAEKLCINCRRGNGHFKICVKLVDKDSVFPEDFFNGACANCLKNSTIGYEHSKLRFGRSLRDCCSC